MKSLGIIAEFNPFHEGHRYLVERAMAETGAQVCIAVMSGDFVQRGAPAVEDKWTRATKAVANGVNLVLELPAVFVCSSAEYFALGGVRILEGLGVDTLAFGSESGDIKALRAAADTLQTHRKPLQMDIRRLMKEGYAYPRARQMAMEAYAPEVDPALIAAPNNILALEYLQQVSTMDAVTVRRSDEGHHESATRIRAELSAADPARFRQMEDRFWRLVSAKILQTDKADLERLLSAGEGLGNKLKKEVRYASSVEELILRLKSKAYTHTRISRLLVQVLLELDREAVASAEEYPYARLLAFDQKGAAFLREVRRSAGTRIPVITNINRELQAHPEIRQTLEKDILASDLYHLICGMDLYGSSDYVMMPGKLP